MQHMEKFQCSVVSWNVTLLLGLWHWIPPSSRNTNPDLWCLYMRRAVKRRTNALWREQGPRPGTFLTHEIIISADMSESSRSVLTCYELPGDGIQAKRFYKRRVVWGTLEDDQLIEKLFWQDAEENTHFLIKTVCMMSALSESGINLWTQSKSSSWMSPAYCH